MRRGAWKNKSLMNTNESALKFYGQFIIFWPCKIYHKICYPGNLLTAKLTVLYPLSLYCTVPLSRPIMKLIPVKISKIDKLDYSALQVLLHNFRLSRQVNLWRRVSFVSSYGRYQQDVKKLPMKAFSGYMRHLWLKQLRKKQFIGLRKKTKCMMGECGLKRTRE